VTGQSGCPCIFIKRSFTRSTDGAEHGRQFNGFGKWSYPQNTFIIDPGLPEDKFIGFNLTTGGSTLKMQCYTYINGSPVPITDVYDFGDEYCPPDKMSIWAWTTDLACTGHQRP